MSNVTLKEILDALPNDSSVRARLSELIEVSKIILEVRLNLDDKVVITNFEEVMTHKSVVKWSNDYFLSFTLMLNPKMAALSSTDDMRSKLLPHIRKIFSSFEIEPFHPSKTSYVKHYQMLLKEALSDAKRTDKVEVGGAQSVEITFVRGDSELTLKV